MEKATPMKPDEGTVNAEFICDHPTPVMIYKCFKCGNRVSYLDGDLYCHHCGQALNWGENQ